MPDQDTLTKIAFIEKHEPSLPDGLYSIAVTQSITATGKIARDNSFTTIRKFQVAGERFNLNPQDIHSVFPPENSQGDHSNVLPHIVLNRSTLPWERKATGDIPWLALLLFDDGEEPGGTTDKADCFSKLTGTDSEKEEAWVKIRTPQILKLGALNKPGDGRGFKWQDVVAEPGQKEEDKVTVIDVPKGLLEDIIPSGDEMQYLSHVRQGQNDDGGLAGDELAIVICNRLPEKGGSSTVHLVSLENRFGANGNFNFGKAETTDYIRLVSLKSWKFSCAKPEHSFQDLLKNLDSGFLKNYALTLPYAENAKLKKYLEKGYVPLLKHAREGEKTASWYHSPLSTGTDERLSLSDFFPIKTADALLRYHQDIGMFDVSYAAAWELGRLLALKDKPFSIRLNNWKREHFNVNKANEQLSNSHLPFGLDKTVAPELPKDLEEWFANICLLKNIPFNYLIPQESMLPKESIRFFELDAFWIASLIDGAFSLGNAIPSDHARDHENHKEKILAIPSKNVTGFILRSEVVSGWPGLLADGFNVIPIDETLPVKLLRMDRLSKNVLICLFEGVIQAVDIHLKPETLHFGLTETPGGDQVAYSKKLRNMNGEDSGINISPVEMKVSPNGGEKRVLDIIKFKDAIAGQKTALKFTEDFNAAQFALAMVEGVPKVRFIKK